MRSALCTLLLAAGVMCQRSKANGIVTTVTCSALNYPVLTSTSACAEGINYVPDSALASVAASLSVGHYAVDASITVSSTAMGDYASEDPFSFVVSDATAAADVSVTLQTGGPVRSGYMGLSFPQFGSVPTLGTSNGWSNTATLTIGSFQVGCGNASAVEYCPAAGLYDFNSAAMVLLPITLGQALPLDFNVSNEAYSDRFSGFASGGFAGAVELRFFETDGTTPVALSEVPEPATWSLGAFAFAAALFLGGRHRLTTNRNP